MKVLTSSAKGFQYSVMAGVRTRWGSVKAFWTCQERPWANNDDLKKFHNYCDGTNYLGNIKDTNVSHFTVLDVSSHIQLLINCHLYNKFNWCRERWIIFICLWIPYDLFIHSHPVWIQVTQSEKRRELSSLGNHILIFISSRHKKTDYFNMSLPRKIRRS